MNKKERIRQLVRDIVVKNIRIAYKCKFCNDCFCRKEDCLEHIVKEHLCQRCKHYRWKLYDSGGEMGVSMQCTFRKDGKQECSLECFVPKDEGKDG